VSRAINVDAGEAEVRSACAVAKVGISTLETLLSGGTRVVCQTSNGATTLRRVMSKLVIDGPVQRSGLFVAQRAR